MNMYHHPYATLLCWLPQIYTHHFSVHITFLISVVTTHIMVFLPVHSITLNSPFVDYPKSCQKSAYGSQWAGTFPIWNGDFAISLQPLTLPSVTLLFPVSSFKPEWDAPSGKHLAESKEAAERIRTGWKFAKVQFHIRRLPDCWGGEYPLATSWSKKALVNTIAFPLLSLFPLGQQLMPKIPPLGAFWERYLIAFTCSNHHIRSPARKRPDKTNVWPRHLH